MMKWIILIGVLAAVFIIIKKGKENATYNDIVKCRNNVKNSWAHIDAQLQRRFDLIPNLAEIAKSFAIHEKQIFESMETIAKEYSNAQTNKEKLDMNVQLTAQIKSLYSVIENYPQLKSDKHFLQLQAALTEIEEDISYARQFYNDAVTIYNNKIMSHPGNQIALKHGFKEESLFDASKAAESAIKINLNYTTKTQCPVCGAAVPNTNETTCKYCGCSLV